MAKTLHLIQDYNPNVTRRELTARVFERLFNVFCGNLKFESKNLTLTQYEKADIYTRLWENGTFAITEAKSTPLQQELEQSPGYLFLPYTISKLSIYQFPMRIKNAPLEKSNIVDLRKTYTVGVDSALVFWSPYSRRHWGYGVKATARRYVKEIVRVMMTINTNLLLHKMPFLVDCEESQKPALIEALRQVFNDFPAVFTGSTLANKLNAMKTDTPYIIDKLDDYITRKENEFLEEIGIDAAKNVSPGQDRLLLDEVNANNNRIEAFRNCHITCLNDGFEEAAKIFEGFDLKASFISASVRSVHQDIREGEPTPENEEDNPQ